MAGWKAIRDKIVTVVESASGIGMVHGRRRQLRQLNQWLTENVKNGRVNTAEISRTSRQRELEGVSNLAVWRITHGAEVRLHMSVADAKATEDDFMDLLDAVDDKLRADPLLGAPGSELLLIPFVTDISEITHRMLGDYLVHTATITFDAIERVQ